MKKNINNIKNGFLTDLTDYKNIYFLGLLWADGSLYTKTKRIQYECKAEDFDNNIDFSEYLEKYGIVCISGRQRYMDRKKFGLPLKNCAFGNTKFKLFEFLVENDYHIKSGASPDKILSKIPEHLQHYWWRGYFDGDGCLYINTRNDLSFWSGIEQDWGFAKKMATKIGMNNSYIRKLDYVKHYSSQFTTQNINDIFNFLKYIYPNKQIDIGFQRKYQKYLDLILKIKTPKRRSKKIQERYNAALLSINELN